MVDIFSDQDIQRLIKEKKPLPKDYKVKIQVRPKRGHKERELDIEGEDGNDFRLILRQSTLTLWISLLFSFIDLPNQIFYFV